MTATSAAAKPVPKLDIRGAFVRRVDLARAILREADLSNADASGASFRGADFQDARLSGTILRGADLTDARNLTEAQLAEAVIDDQTRLPPDLDRAEILRLAQGRSQPTDSNQ